MDDSKPGNLKEAMATELREVAAAQGPVEAEVIKSLLASANIPCLMKGLVVQSVHAFSADGLGKIRIMVAQRDYAAAKQLIEEHLVA
ncbi:MAG: DUF2007 domain-containing protein [Candidatus Aminicenantaceae bacterium]